MTTKLQAWGNSHGVRLPKALLSSLQWEAGASLEVVLSPKKNAIIVKPSKLTPQVRKSVCLEALVAAMPKDYKAADFSWDRNGREVW